MGDRLSLDRDELLCQANRIVSDALAFFSVCVAEVIQCASQPIRIQVGYET